jgi:hypothetical protein
MSIEALAEQRKGCARQIVGLAERRVGRREHCKRLNPGRVHSQCRQAGVRPGTAVGNGDAGEPAGDGLFLRHDLLRARGIAETADGEEPPEPIT